MTLSERFKAANRWFLDWFYRIPPIPRDSMVTILFLFAAFMASRALIGHTGGENNSALVFVLAVAFISLITTGYIYGIIASIAGTFFINVYFMYPYAEFSLSQTGYPVAMLSMVAISCVICALTARVKQQASEAVRREKNTKILYEMNEKLNAEKAAIQMESARESIRSNILRAVSHDLRTPLTSISGSASVLMSSPEVSEKNIAMLADIKHDADSLIVMVENLLSFTRIQDSTAPLKKREEMLEEVAGDALLTTRRRFPDYKVELNLYRRDDWAMVEVRDRGKGLSPEICQNIMSGKPLKRDLSGDSTRGMGIGLSACQSIIQAHGGFFAAGNDPEGGAVFRFGLPMEEPNHE